MEIVDERILGVLVCPITGGELVYDAENSELVSKDAGLAFPVREGVPIMLLHEARKLS